MKIPSSETAPWNLAEGDNSGSPRIIRYRPDLGPFIGIESHPQRLVIIWDYEAENSSGMPSNKQSDEMKAFEGALTSALDPNRLAVLAFVLTTNGSREWHFYVSNIEEAGKKINNALSGFPKLPIHLQVESDPEWEQISIVYSICS